MDQQDKPARRRNKFAGKENISRETVDNIITGQVDRLLDVSRQTDCAATKLLQSVDVLYKKQIPVNTEKFEQLNRYFIGQMEDKLKKVKRPSKGLVWYIIMWGITLVSGVLAGYFINEYIDLKQEAAYWYQQANEKTSK